MNMMRIGEFYSGMDTQQMIKDMMRVQRFPMEKLLQQKQLIEWKQEDYRTLNRNLFSFRDQVFDLKLQSTFITKNATSSDPQSIKAAITGATTEGSYNIKVENLASGAFMTSVTEMAIDSVGKDLKEQFEGVDWNGKSEGNFTIKGKGEGTGTIEFDITKDSIEDIIVKINQKSVDEDMGIIASYDAVSKRISLISTSTGEDTKIEFSGIEGAGKELLTDAFKLGDLNDEGKITATGQDATIELNGRILKQSTNEFTIAGISINLLKADPNVTNTITVHNNIDGVFDKIKDFVEQYNKIIEDANTKLTEKKQRDFPPLSEDQKKDMSEKEIELWEEKARSGLFRNDNILSSLTSTMRTATMEPLQGSDSKYNSLYAIGIATGPDWQSGGKLYIDEDKLKKALQEDLEGVTNLFTATSEEAGKNGIADRIHNIVTNASAQIVESAGRDSSLLKTDESILGKNLQDVNSKIITWEQRLAKLEDRYWAQFSAMEAALHRLYSQSSWLEQQFM